MGWITTKTGKRVNTDWFDEDINQKDRQIAANKKIADSKNDKFADYRELSTPKTGGSNPSKVREQLQAEVKKAEKAGYERVPRYYDKRGASGQIYHKDETYITVPVKNGKISGSSSLAKHLKDTKEKYADVIVMQVEPSVPVTTRSRRGSYSQKGFEATYIVMARRKK